MQGDLLKALATSVATSQQDRVVTTPAASNLLAQLAVPSVRFQEAREHEDMQREGGSASVNLMGVQRPNTRFS